MKIGELARRAGCQVPTIRYYEQEGLLRPPLRTEKNYRVYGEEDVERLQFIRHCREHQISLEEIRELLAYRDGPQRDCTWVSELIGERIAAVDAQIQSLVQLKTYLEELRGKCAGNASAKTCGIMRSLEDMSLCPCAESKELWMDARKLKKASDDQHGRARKQLSAAKSRSKRGSAGSKTGT